jgi:L-methionine (R)-S-oxide reductase
MVRDEILAKRYERIWAQLQDLFAETGNKISRMAAAAALLHHKMPHFFWTGFYILTGEELLVGPYQGTLACLSLEKNQGVCWAAVRRRTTILVPDVREFPGHIACDSRSKSEIAVPLSGPDGNVYAVLDVDSRRLGAFSEVDREWLEKIAALF